MEITSLGWKRTGDEGVCFPNFFAFGTTELNVLYKKTKTVDTERLEGCSEAFFLVLAIQNGYEVIVHRTWL